MITTTGKENTDLRRAGIATPEENARSKKAVELLRVRALMSADENEPLFHISRPF